MVNKNETTTEENTDHIRSERVQCPVELVDSLVWSLNEAEIVDQGQEIATIGSNDLGNFVKITAPCSGTLRYADMQGLKSISDRENVDIARIEYCVHPLVNGRTCMMCLAIVCDYELSGDRASVSVVSHGQVIRLNIEEARKFDSNNIERQLKSRKLSLVLDLDHTLLHAVRLMDLLTPAPPASDEVHYFTLPGMQSVVHVVKLRPGLKHFLERLNTMYDLFIYTHGTRVYAEEIAKIIDPQSELFHHRIVARTDTPEMHHKSLKLLFPSCDDSMILILDDRLDVWKENEGNVVLIEPYHFFKCSAEINNFSGNPGMSSGVSETDENVQMDGNLSYILSIFKRLHGSFYNENEDDVVAVQDQMDGKGKDVKRILAEQQHNILKGCCVAFSGVFPLDAQYKPEHHDLWKLAISLGAEPSLRLSENTTHLVIHPMRLGTQKHVQARAMPNLHVVTPDWLIKSGRIWQRAPEANYLADKWKESMADIQQTEQKPSVSEANDIAVDGSFITNEQLSPNLQAPAPSAPKLRILSQPKSSIATNRTRAHVNSSKKTVQFDAASKFDANHKVAPNKRRLTVVAKKISTPVGSKGTVASGGTFDFLSKLSGLAARSRPSTNRPDSVLNGQKTQSKGTCARQVKDVDFTFNKLIEAEEQQNALDQQKQSQSSDIKEALARRRHVKRCKHDKSSEILKVDNDETSSDLDDLEQAIFDDL